MATEHHQKEERMRCSQCGCEHDILDPAFGRPDVIHQMRQRSVKESDDLCVLRAEAPERMQYFIRCVLPVKLLDRDEPAMWGLWAEVSAVDFQTIRENWTNPDQASLAPMQAALANKVPGYPLTIGMVAALRLTGPTTRPSLELQSESNHPFAVEVRSGVTIHRLDQWLRGMAGSGSQ